MADLRNGEPVPLSLLEASQIMVHVVKDHVNAPFHAIDSVHCKRTPIGGCNDQLPMHLLQCSHTKVTWREREVLCRSRCLNISMIAFRIR